jgi:hypothetical protein
MSVSLTTLARESGQTAWHHGMAVCNSGNQGRTSGSSVAMSVVRHRLEHSTSLIYCILINSRLILPMTWQMMACCHNSLACHVVCAGVSLTCWCCIPMGGWDYNKSLMNIPAEGHKLSPSNVRKDEGRLLNYMCDHLM